MATSVKIHDPDPRVARDEVVEYNPGSNLASEHTTIEINGADFADVDDNVLLVLTNQGFYTIEEEPAE
jgi:hypothetical protein